MNAAKIAEIRNDPRVKKYLENEDRVGFIWINGEPVTDDEIRQHHQECSSEGCFISYAVSVYLGINNPEQNALGCDAPEKPETIPPPAIW